MNKPCFLCKCKVLSTLTIYNALKQVDEKGSSWLEIVQRPMTRDRSEAAKNGWGEGSLIQLFPIAEDKGRSEAKKS